MSLFVAFDGQNGEGKSKLIENLTNRLKEHNSSYLHTKESFIVYRHYL